MVYLLLITGILTVIIGIAEAVNQKTQPYVAHIVVASIFILVCILHIVINHKAVMRYIKGK